MLDYLKSTIETYKRNVDKYHASTAFLIHSHELDEFSKLLPDGNRKVLDAGCATGKGAVELVKRGLDARGIDITEEFVVAARKLHPDVSFDEMDVLNLTFDDNTFAGIWCDAVLLHFKDSDFLKALEEFYRVLIEGGIVNFSVKEGSRVGTIQEKFSADGDRFYNFHTVEGLEQLISKTQFKLVDIHINNERERFGPEARDLNWIWVTLRK